MNIEKKFMEPKNRFREMINLSFVFQPSVFFPNENDQNQKKGLLQVKENSWESIKMKNFGI